MEYKTNNKQCGRIMKKSVPLALHNSNHPHDFSEPQNWVEYIIIYSLTFFKCQGL